MMNLAFVFALLALSTVALFWRGRSGYSLADTWPPGVGLIVHGVLVILCALALTL